jgi:hypothetical protein
VPDIATKTNGDICRRFSSRQAWDANVALQITLIADARVMTLPGGTVIPITSHGTPSSPFPPILCTTLPGTILLSRPLPPCSQQPTPLT